MVGKYIDAPKMHSKTKNMICRNSNSTTYILGTLVEVCSIIKTVYLSKTSDF